MPRRPSRAFDALHFLRHPDIFGKMTATEAAERAGTTVRAMKRTAGVAMRKVGGEWVYHPRDDRAIRTTSGLFKTAEGPRWVQIEVRALSEASKAGQFARAIESGKWDWIESFAGRYVTDTSGRRWYFATDRASLQRLDREGGLRPRGLRFS